MKRMRENVLTHTHIKRNLAIPLAEACITDTQRPWKGSQTQGSPVELRYYLEIRTMLKG